MTESEGAEVEEVATEAAAAAVAGPWSVDRMTRWEEVAMRGFTEGGGCGLRAVLSAAGCSLRPPDTQLLTEPMIDRERDDRVKTINACPGQQRSGVHSTALSDGRGVQDRQLAGSTCTWPHSDSGHGGGQRHSHAPHRPVTVHPMRAEEVRLQQTKRSGPEPTVTAPCWAAGCWAVAACSSAQPQLCHLLSASTASSTSSERYLLPRLEQLLLPLPLLVCPHQTCRLRMSTMRCQGSRSTLAS